MIDAQTATVAGWCATLSNEYHAPLRTIAERIGTTEQLEVEIAAWCARHAAERAAVLIAKREAPPRPKSITDRLVLALWEKG